MHASWATATEQRSASVGSATCFSMRTKPQKPPQYSSRRSSNLPTSTRMPFSSWPQLPPASERPWAISEGGLALLEPALTTAERHGLDQVMANALFAKSNALYREGRRRESLAITELARQVAAETGQTDLEIRATGNLATRRSELDWKAALDAYDDQLELARRTSRREALLGVVGNYGYAAFLAGKWDSGLELLTQTLVEEMAARDRLLIQNNQLIMRASRGEDVPPGSPK